MGKSKKKKKKKRTEGAAIWNFLEYQKKSMCNFQELMKNKMEFQRLTKKK